MPGLYPTGLSTLHASLGSTFGSLRTGGSYSSEGTEISRLQRPQLTVGRTGAVVGAVLGGRRIWLALAGRVLAGLVLIASTQRMLVASAAAVIVALMLLTHLGVPQGNDGSDQITLIIAVAVLLARIVPADSLAQRACLAFVAAQLLLSYLAAGASKLAGSTWRKGTAMADIASTHSHGSPAISRMLVRHPFAGRLGSWGTIAFELSMPGVLFLPSVAAPLLLCVAIGFHVVADAAAARLASAGTWRGGVLVTKAEMPH
jgi:hypothetical protein